MIAEASAALSSIKVAMDMAKGLSALKSEAETMQATIEIQRTLADALSATLTDKEKIADLNEKVKNLEADLNIKHNWKSETDRYALHEFPAGAFAYVLRPEMANGEPQHKLCATCFQKQQKSILHTMAKHSGGELVRCTTCKQDITLAHFNTKPARSIPRYT